MSGETVLWIVAALAGVGLIALVAAPLTFGVVRRWANSHSFAAQTMATLLATFLGVVLATLLTDWQKQAEDRAMPSRRWTAWPPRSRRMCVW
jgi:Kef-type K+ transport system membrane component KefB